MYLSLAYEDLKNIEYIDFSGSKRIFAQDLYLQFTKNFPKLKTLILKGTRPSFHNISDEEWKDMSEEEKVITWNQFPLKMLPSVEHLDVSFCKLKNN